MEKTLENKRKKEKTGGKSLNNDFVDKYVFAENTIITEKRQIKQRAMFVGLALLVALAAQLFWSLLYFNIMRLFGFDTEAATEIARQPIVGQLINQILSVICFTFPFLIVASGCGLKLGEIASYKKPEKEHMLPIIFISISFFAFANIASSVFLNLLAYFGINATSPPVTEAEGVFGFIVTFVGAAIIAPLTEEFAIRGVVLGSLRKYGDGFAILTSALLFGLMHGNFAQIPFAFVVGVALGFAVVKTGSVWTGVIIHFINNAAAVILDTATKNLPMSIKLMANTGYFALCFICLFIGILLLKGKTKEMVKLSSGECELPAKKVASQFFSSPFIIGYIVLIVLNALGNAA